MSLCVSVYLLSFSCLCNKTSEVLTFFVLCVDLWMVCVCVFMCVYVVCLMWVFYMCYVSIYMCVYVCTNVCVSVCAAYMCKCVSAALAGYSMMWGTQTPAFAKRPVKVSLWFVRMCYVCGCVCVYVCVHVCLCVCFCVCFYMWVYMCICVFKCVFICVYLSVCLCVCVNVCQFVSAALASCLRIEISEGLVLTCFKAFTFVPNVMLKLSIFLQLC